MCLKYILFHPTAQSPISDIIYLLRPKSHLIILFPNHHQDVLNKFIFHPKMTTFHAQSPLSKQPNPQTKTPFKHKPSPQSPIEITIDHDRLYEAIFKDDQRNNQSLVMSNPQILIGLAQDNYQIQRLKQILYVDTLCPAFREIRLQVNEWVDLERLARLKAVYNLTKSKSLNLILVRSISSYLQDILSSSFTPIASNRNQSKILQQLYLTINQINQKIMTLAQGSHSQIVMSNNRELTQLKQQNRALKSSLSLSEAQLSKSKQQMLQILSELNRLKKQVIAQQNKALKYQQSVLELKENYLLQLQVKDRLFGAEVDEVIELKSRTKDSTSEVFYEEIQFGIEDFKSLIVKLNEQNRILKEEREMLMAKIDNIQQNITTFVKRISLIEEQCSAQLKDEASQGRRNAIDKLQLQIQHFRRQIEQKDQIIKQMQIELQCFGRKQSPSVAKHNFASIEQLNQTQNKELQSLLITVETLKFNLLQQKAEQNKGQSRQHSAQRDTLMDQRDMLIDDNRVLKQTIISLQEQLRQQGQAIKGLMVIIADFSSSQKRQLRHQQSAVTDNVSHTQLSSSISQAVERSQQEQRQGESNTKRVMKQGQNLLQDQLQRIDELRRQVQMLQSDGIKREQLSRLQLQQKDRQFAKRLEQQSDALSALQRQLQLKNEQLLNRNEQLVNRDEQLLNLRSQLQSSQKMLDFTKSRSKENDLLAKSAQKKYKSLVISKQFKQKYRQIQIEGLFHGALLEDSPEQKLYLKTIVQNKLKKAIRRTRLLWRLDPCNKTNFHHYIDHKQHFVMIVKLVNGLIVGGFSEGKLYPKMVSDKDAIIFSLSKRECFELIEAGKKAVTYDENYIIFGSSQLRVKFQDNNFFSNFGINTSHFRARGLKVDVLTGSGEREVQLENVQIHQVVFY